MVYHVNMVPRVWGKLTTRGHQFQSSFRLKSPRKNSLVHHVNMVPRDLREIERGSTSISIEFWTFLYHVNMVPRVWGKLTEKGHQFQSSFGRKNPLVYHVNMVLRGLREVDREGHQFQSSFGHFSSAFPKASALLAENFPHKNSNGKKLKSLLLSA